MGVLRHEAGRLVVFQFSHWHESRLLSGQKKRPPKRSLQIFISTRERAMRLSLPEFSFSGFA
jgi:hypothetical protein